MLLLCTETQVESSASGEVILGSVLGVSIFGAMAIITAISAILCLIKKGKYNRGESVYVATTYLHLICIIINSMHAHPICFEYIEQ